MLKFETKQIHCIEYHDWDRFIEQKFPNCPYNGIACEEEMSNDSVWSSNDIDGNFSPEWLERTEKYLHGDGYNFVSTRDMLNYLVRQNILPAGNYNIAISW